MTWDCSVARWDNKTNDSCDWISDRLGWSMGVNFDVPLKSWMMKISHASPQHFVKVLVHQSRLWRIWGQGVWKCSIFRGEFNPASLRLQHQIAVQSVESVSVCDCVGSMGCSERWYQLFVSHEARWSCFRRVSLCAKAAKLILFAQGGGKAAKLSLFYEMNSTNSAKLLYWVNKLSEKMFNLLAAFHMSGGMVQLEVGIKWHWCQMNIPGGFWCWLWKTVSLDPLTKMVKFTTGSFC